MNLTDRTEFDAQLAVLCAGMDVPCTQERKDAYWRGLQRMTLSIFVRTVEYVLGQETWIRIPKPGQLWEVSRRMRAAGPPLPPKDDGFRGDAWDAAANRYLLGHLTTRLRKGMRLPGTPATYRAMQADQRTRDVLGLDRHTLDASPDFVAEVRRLVALKNAWAADMRDMAINGEVEPETQKAVWHDYFKTSKRA